MRNGSQPVENYGIVLAGCDAVAAAGTGVVAMKKL
jgi:hypothetical protein